MLRWRLKSARGLTRKKRRKVSRSSTTSHPPVRMQTHQTFPCPVFSVIATARELGVVIQAYSPIGQGFFSGKIKTRADLDPTDGRLRFERFSEEVLFLADGFTSLPADLSFEYRTCRKTPRLSKNSLKSRTGRESLPLNSASHGFEA